MSSRSVARRPRQRLGRRPLPPRSARPRAGLTAPRGGFISRFLPAAVIAAGIVAVVVIALGQLGTAKSSARTESEVVTATDGVVQSSVTGTGSLEPVTEEDVDFQTSGTLSRVDVKDGEFVHKGQLLATLGDTTAALTLKQARATLAEARTTLSSDEKTLDDESSDSTDTSDTVEQQATAEDVSYSPTASTPASSTPTSTTPTSTTPASTTASTPATTTPTETVTVTESATTPARTTARTTATEPTETTTTASGSGSTRSASSSSGTSTGSSSSSSTGSSSSSSSVTAATIDADKLQIVEDEQTVKEDRAALSETRLRAPVSGTITSLESIAPGDSVSSGSTSSAAASSASDSTGTTGATGSTGASDSTSSTGSSSSSFAVIDTLKHLSMTVSFTEADINKIKVGQPVVVTLDAISGLELAGKVTEVSSLGTTTDSVTSYDATVTLDQYDSRVKPGMSASAEVVIKQGHGVTVPSGAVTGSGTLATVTEDVNGKQTTKKVIVGIRGDSRDLIVSGLSAGAELVETETLPAEGSSASTSSSSASSATSGSSGRAAGGLSSGFGGGGGFGAGGGGFSGGGGPP